MLSRLRSNIVVLWIVRLLALPMIALLYAAGFVLNLLYGICGSIGMILAGLGGFAAFLALLDALIVLQEERRKCIILVLFIIFSNAIIVFAVGYCMVYSFQKDLIEKNRRNKRKEPKKNLSRKHKYRWKNKDYQLIGWLLIIVAIVFYGAYVNWQGIQNAQKQELFLTTRIDNDTYIVVMTDGDEAILEKDRTGKDGKLKICKDKYMKVDCKNRLLEKKKYRRASGDGE